MEIDLASFNQELKQSMHVAETSNGKEDDHHLPPASRLKSLNEIPKETPASESPSLSKELSDLKERHAEEINQWKEYDRRIQEWKQQVQDVFQNLKKEAAGKQELASDLIKCKAALKSKDKEIETLRAYIEQKEGKESIDKLIRS